MSTPPRKTAPPLPSLLPPVRRHTGAAAVAAANRPPPHRCRRCYRLAAAPLLSLQPPVLDGRGHPSAGGKSPACGRAPPIPRPSPPPAGRRGSRHHRLGPSSHRPSAVATRLGAASALAPLPPPGLRRPAAVFSVASLTLPLPLPTTLSSAGRCRTAGRSPRAAAAAVSRPPSPRRCRLPLQLEAAPLLKPVPPAVRRVAAAAVAVAGWPPPPG